jgi:hypothetical protein
MENSSLVGVLTNSIKDHSRAFGVAGAVVGAFLVIYYCGSISFYPSGLTIADALFFLWAVIVFGFYYSVVAFAFFIASTFWIFIFSKPINLILKLTNNKNNIVVSSPKSDWFIVFVGGGISNTLIIGISYLKNHSLIAIFGALFLIGFILSMIEHVSNRRSSNNEILNISGNPIESEMINPQVVKYFFYIFIYVAPLMLGQVGGGVTRTTFETMGVRQAGVTIHIEAKDYKAVLERYESAGLISSLSCGEVCTLEGVNVLFTSIGTNSKLEVEGENGSLLFVLPTKAIKLTTLPKPNKLTKVDNDLSPITRAPNLSSD